MFKDDEFHFSIRLPAGWALRTAATPYDRVRLFAASPDGRQGVSVYAIRADSPIDVEKLAASDRALFRNLGTMEQSGKKPAFFLLRPNRIYKIYRSGSYMTRLLFKADANYGYVVSWRGPHTDFFGSEAIIETFRVSVPLTEKAGRGFRALVLIVLGLASLVSLAYINDRETKQARPIALAVGVPSALLLGYLILLRGWWRETIDLLLDLILG